MPVTVTAVAAETLPAWIRTAYDVVPAPSVTVDGTAKAALLLLDKLTVAPPLPAGPLNVTVRTANDPVATDPGLITSEESVVVDTGTRVAPADFVTPL